MDENIYKAPASELHMDATDAMELATRLSRFGASIVDGLSIGVVTIPVMFFTGGFSGISTGQQPSYLYSAAIGLLGIALFVVINFNSLSARGQTLGKRVLGIKVVTMDNQLPSMADHFLKRYAIYILPGQIPIVGPFINLINILFIFNKNRRCIHDLVANTKVVKA